MTDRELRLRQKIDDLRDERDTLKAMLGRAKPKQVFGTCPWCGIPSYGVVCKSHRDVEHIYRGLG